MTDSCPACCVRGIAPSDSRTGDTAVVHGYRCPGCGHTWATSRHLSAYSDIHRRRTERQNRSAAA